MARKRLSKYPNFHYSIKPAAGLNQNKTLLFRPLGITPRLDGVMGPLSAMDSKLTTNLGEKDNFIVFLNSQGVEARRTLLRLTRYLAVFEVYNPYSILQMSEVLGEFRIIVNDRMIYSGRGIVSNLVNTGILLVCEATLDESWLDVNLFSPVNKTGKLRETFGDFFTEWKKKSHRPRGL